MAGVSDDGTAVSWSRLREQKAPVREVVSGATDLLRPAWDVQGTLWLVDRSSDGALVLTVAGGRRASLIVPGVTGEQVRRFLVSRDGSRLVAVLRRPNGDALVVSRLRRDEQGRVVSATPAREVPWTTGVGRIQDIGWRSPTSVSVLSQPTEDKADVHTVAVDGSPGFALPSATRPSGRMRWLVSSPVATEHSYAVARNGLISDLSGPTPVERPAGVALSTLTYAG
ncbi:MAG: LpqB family beta-propeller domain-containing protein [Nocardioides sp.]